MQQGETYLLSENVPLVKQEDIPFVSLKFDLLLPLLAELDFFLPELHPISQLLLLLYIAETLNCVDVLGHIVHICNVLEEALPLALLEIRYLLVKLNDSARIFE